MKHKIELKKLQGIIPELPATGDIKRLPRKRKKLLKKRIYAILEWSMKNDKMFEIIEGLDNLVKEFDEVHDLVSQLDSSVDNLSDSSKSLNNVVNVLDGLISKLATAELTESKKQNED